MYLVTGGAGFIGSHTVELLLGEGHAVRVLDDLSTGRRANLAGLDVDLVEGSITDPATVASAMVGVERVIHLAARVSVPGSIARPLAYDHTNVRGFLHVLEAAREVGVKRVVYASSCAVYGSIPGLPKREDAPLAPESPYASSKMANEAYARAYSRTMGVSAVGVRYFNVFGPRQDPAGPYGAVIPKFVDRALRGQSLTIYGDGEQGRDFVSVKDVARANVRASQTTAGGGMAFNIGGGRMTTVNQLAAEVVEGVGPHVKVVHSDPRPGDILLSLADIRQASEVLGWAPEAAFDVALSDTVAWFRAQLTT